MKDFEYEDVDPKRTFATIAVGFLVSFIVANAKDLSGGSIFAFGWAMFALGWLCVFAMRKATAREKLAQEQYEESDWRHFDQLKELSGAELEELRAIAKSPSQVMAALGRLDEMLGMGPVESSRAFEFFVRSGWASKGELSEEWFGFHWSGVEARQSKP